ncbi:MAG: TRAP transporter small permease [Desulfatibacillaceae bacterium]
METLEKFTERLTAAMHAVAGCAVVLMMLVTCLDVALRYIRKPVPGTFELVYLLGGIAVAFAMARTTHTKGHVAVSIIVGRFTRKWQHIVDGITGLLGLLLFALATWRMLILARTYQTTNMVSPTLELPLYPVIYAMALALAVVCLVQFTTVIRHAGGVLRRWK